MREVAAIASATLASLSKLKAQLRALKVWRSTQFGLGVCEAALPAAKARAGAHIPSANNETQ